MRFLLLAIFSLQQTYAEDFTPVRENVMALQSLEERLLPELEAFIVKKEDLLKELEKMINQTAASKELTRESSVEGYLGTPQNQYFLIKRFVDNWGTFEDLLNSDNSTNGKFVSVSQNSCNWR